MKANKGERRYKFQQRAEVEELEQNLQPKQWGQKKLRILYQSLEYNNNFTKDLASELNKLKYRSKVVAYQGRGCSETIDDRRAYHIAVGDLLKTYIKHIKPELKPDIIILGEYTPDEAFFRYYLEVGDYKRLDYVNSGGARGMTILYRIGMRNVHRITVHDKSGNIVDCWLEDDTSLKRLEKHNERKGTDFTIEQYSACRDEMKARWHNTIEYTGECIEIMYANRYIAMVHVPNGSSVEKAKTSLTDYIPFVFMAGDLNMGMSCKNHVNKTTKKDGTPTKNALCGAHIKNINTNVEPLLKLSSTYAGLQLQYNKEGTTNSAFNKAHDGLYSRNQPLTELSIIGSIWPIIDKDCFGVSNKEYYLMGDHKGFLMELTTGYEKKPGKSDSYYKGNYDNLSTCSVETLKDRMLDLD